MAEQVKNNDKIIEVVVYPDRAYVTRLISCELESGKQSITFFNLPPHTSRESINVKLESNNNYKIEGVDLKDERLENISNSEIFDLENRLKELLIKLSGINNKLEKLDALYNHIDNIKNNLADNLLTEFYNRITTIEEIQNNFDFLFQNYDHIIEEKNKLTKEKNILNVSITSLKNELSLKKKARYKNVLQADVLIDAGENGSYNVYLSYIVMNTGWHSLYDARVDFIRNEIELSYYGVVNQFTGENWNDIQIYLSTANPQAGAGIPELSPVFLRINGYENVYPASGSILSSASVIGEDKPAVIEAKPEKAGLNVNFKILKKDTINSDGSEKRLLIAKQKFPVVFEYKAIPKQVEKVFIKGKIKNSENYPFLSGTVKVFHGSDYIGDSYTKTIIPGEEMNLSLGVDESFTIKRERINKFRSTRGITGNNEKYEYYYKITIENFKDIPQQVIISEPVPISKNKEIKCRLESVTDKIKPDDYGTLNWTKDIIRGIKTYIEIKFSVEYPKSRKISGL